MPFKPMPHGKPYKLLLGLREPESPWLHEVEDDATFVEELAQRVKHLKERREAVLQLVDEPLAWEASRELLEQLLEDLPRSHPHRYKVEGAMITNLATGESFDTAAPGVEPLEVVGRLVQEDICILAAGEGGHQRLLGGVVCFPAHWSVLEKLGKILPDIHDPVPRWRSDAAGPARAFLSALRPEQPFIRWNWTLMPTAELHLSNFYEPPPAPHAAAPEDVSGIERLHLRLERQYFHRLPRSGCLVFTIRTYQRPIREAVEGRPTMAAALAGALRDLPYAHLEYKVGLQHRLPALLELLDAAAQGEGGREGEGGQEGSAGGVVAATATSM